MTILLDLIIGMGAQLSLKRIACNFVIGIRFFQFFPFGYKLMAKARFFLHFSKSCLDISNSVFNLFVLLSDDSESLNFSADLINQKV
ncbi:hypothetical protein D9M71_415810 [compost metagenome]